MMRIFLFCIVIITSMFGAIPLFIAGAVYAIRYAAYELVVFAGLVDAYYGDGFGIPVYTIASMVFLVCIELLKPKLTLYT